MYNLVTEFIPSCSHIKILLHFADMQRLKSDSSENEKSAQQK